MSGFPEVLDISSLRLGEEVGSGGQATVYRLADHPGHLLKRYRGVDADPAALDRLVEWRNSLGPVERETLDVRTCWPRARVTEGGLTIGVIIPEAPPEYLIEIGDGQTRKLNEIQYLTHADRAHRLGLVIPSATVRARLMADFAALLELFDRHSVVHGDISFKNLLWTVDPIPLIYLLDCDGARLGPHPAAVPQVTTQHWTDPRLQHGEIRHPDHDSDRLALGLAFYRTFYSARGDFSGGQIHLQLPETPPLPPEVSAVAQRSLSNDAPRPTPFEWRFLSQVEVDPAFEPIPQVNVSAPSAPPIQRPAVQQPPPPAPPPAPVGAPAWGADPIAQPTVPAHADVPAAFGAPPAGSDPQADQAVFTPAWVAALVAIFICSTAAGWAVISAVS